MYFKPIEVESLVYLVQKINNKVDTERYLRILLVKLVYGEPFYVEGIPGSLSLLDLDIAIGNIKSHLKVYKGSFVEESELTYFIEALFNRLGVDY